MRYVVKSLAGLVDLINNEIGGVIHANTLDGDEIVFDFPVDLKRLSILGRCNAPEPMFTDVLDMTDPEHPKYSRGVTPISRLN